MYRKRVILISDKPGVNKKIIYSPISGEVKKVSTNKNHPVFGEDLIELQLCLPWWKEMGLYLPIAGYVKDVTVGVKNFSFLRLNTWPNIDQKEGFKGSLAIILESDDGDSFGLQLVKCPLGMAGRTWVMPGDRGRVAANFGYIPFGGTVLLYLPKFYEILVLEGDKLIAGESLIAGRS